MENELENFYLKQPEPIQSCLLALRYYILKLNEDIKEQPKYQIPFFYYSNWKLAFLWVQKKKVMVGIITDKEYYLRTTGTKQRDGMETFLLDPGQDIPIEIIREKLLEQIKLYTNVDTENKETTI